MKKTFVVPLVLGLIGLLACAGTSYASGKDDAKELVKQAAAYVKYQGKEKALAEISKPRGMFDKGELYVFAYDLQGVMVAHPKNPALIGKTWLLFRIVKESCFARRSWKRQRQKVPDGSIIGI
jgi:cytochrome c